jgi:hypothetical protein
MGVIYVTLPMVTAAATETQEQDAQVIRYVFDRLLLSPPDPRILPLALSKWPGYSLDRSSSGNLRVWRGDVQVVVFYPAAWAMG